jgi:hypothetical protein
MLITDMSSRIEQSKNECPTEWTSQGKHIGKGSVDVRGNYEETMESIGKYAPVSIPG